jgi:hypothetical protein
MNKPEPNEFSTDKVSAARKLWAEFKALRVVLPLYGVALLAAFVIVMRITWPDVLFDTTALILFSIAAACILLPCLLQILPPLKRFSLGPVEAEFVDRAINKMEQKVVLSEAKSKQKLNRFTPKEMGSVGWQKYFDEYAAILKSSTSNQLKVLTASNLIERMLFNAAVALGVSGVDEGTNPVDISESLFEAKLISADEKTAFDEFWSLRHRLVHGSPHVLSDEQTARVLDIAGRLMRILA